ncbi:MAG: hypothetical protein IJT05_08455 [Lachnospiraceae bacterium]|nr:hypothetical protein [Lachnospiraceae bacterium]
MNKLLNRIERKIGKYAIKNLVAFLIVGYVIGYIIYFISPNTLAYLTLEPHYILKGQIWRLVSWVLIPPSGGISGISILFAAIMMLFYYQLGRALERTWGAFRFNCYMFGGMLFTILGAFILHGIFYGTDALIQTNAGALPYRECLAMLDEYKVTANIIGGMFSTSYINESIFLAFAVMYPDMKVLLYFIIPVKMKWMAIFYGVIILIDVIRSDWAGKMAILASILNFLIFFFGTRDYSKLDPRRRSQQQAFHSGYTPFGNSQNQAQGRSAGPGQGARTIHPGGAKAVARHRCAVCGRTEESNPELEFRFCSRCNGNYEYCQDHLFTHTHVQ